MTFKAKNDGFTLIELIVTTVVVGIVSTILVYLLVTIFGTLQENRMKKQLLMDGYNSTIKFVREFELIPNEPNLLIATASQIQFNTVIGGVTTTITYQIVGNQLQRRVGVGALVVISTNITGQFEYFQKSHFNMPPPLGGPDRLRTRRVRLTLNMLDNQGNRNYTYVADAFPENYRFSGGGS